MKEIEIVLEFISAILFWVFLALFRIGSKLDILASIMENIREIKEREEKNHG